LTVWLVVLSVLAVLLLIKPSRNFALGMFSKIRGFLKEVVEELKKVAWPTRSELKSSTGLVIISMLILIVFIAVIDLLLGGIVGLFVR
jgi:preprotein translocase subunit SecE